MQTYAYRPVFYLPLIVLRILGDVASDLALRQWGGMLNVTAILLFMGLILWTAVRDLTPKQVADTGRV